MVSGERILHPVELAMKAGVGEKGNPGVFHSPPFRPVASTSDHKPRVTSFDLHGLLGYHQHLPLDARFEKIRASMSVSTFRRPPYAPRSSFPSKQGLSV